MRLKNTLCISIENIMHQKARFFLSTVMIGLSMIGIGYFMMFSNVSKYVKDECDRVLAGGVDGTGVMKVSDIVYEVKKLKEEAMASGKIECIGTWMSGDMFWVLSEDLVPEPYKNKDGPKMFWVSIDRTMLGICNLRFYKKRDVPEEKWKDPDWYGIYLGWEYRHIPLGTVYKEDIMLPGITKEYEVIGILEKGQEFISDTVVLDGMGNGVYSVESWDNAVIVPMELYVSDRVMTNYLLYTPKEGISMGEAKSYLEEKAKELGLRPYFFDLREGFYLEELNQQDYRRIEKELCVMLCVTCVLINVCLLIIQLIRDKKEMGIFYACGFSHRDVFAIYVWQSILKIMIAWTVGFVGLKVLCQQSFNYHTDSPWKCPLGDRWFHYRALPPMTGFAIVLIGTFILIQACMMHRSVPAELMKDSRG